MEPSPVNWGKLLGSLTVLLSLLASLAYFWQRDYRRGIYWAAAAVLTGSVTY